MTDDMAKLIRDDSTTLPTWTESQVLAVGMCVAGLLTCIKPSEERAMLVVILVRQAMESVKSASVSLQDQAKATQ